MAPVRQSTEQKSWIMKITFLPKEIMWEGESGADLMTIAAQAGVILDGSCGGKGICGKCRVLIDGKSVLACKYEPQRDITVMVPSDEELTSRKVSMSGLPSSFVADNSYMYDTESDEPALGIAFDVGTTTVVGALFDLRTAESLGMMARTNPQGVHGADVISRIQYAGEPGSKGLRELHRLIISCMDDIASHLMELSGSEAEYLRECVVCGNTTMSHLVANMSPASLAFRPFAPAYTGSFRCLGGDLGFSLQPDAEFTVIPNIAGHVGSDITADLLALRERIGTSRALMIDVGTNGEIYCRNGTQEVVCSTAAGPAFEGATIKMGMRAASGAIERVSLGGDGSLEIATIGDTVPVGICGSGIIDAIALLVTCGIVEESGRFAKGQRLRDLGLSKDMVERMRRNPNDGQMEFVLYRGEGTNDVVITQNDVREVQLGKGALKAGTTLLLRGLGLSVDELDHVFVAGAFGNYIDLAAAQTIGLIPPCDPQKVEFVGNAAIAGALMYLLSMPLRSVAEELTKDIDHIELAEDSSFQRVYLEALSLRVAKGS